jgi:tetraacyldisaccharide 4'-kinase
MILSREELGIIISVVDAETTKFDELVRIAGLDPAIDLQGCDLSGVDLGDSSYVGFSFAGANLCGAKLNAARHLQPEMFMGAKIDETTEISYSLLKELIARQIIIGSIKQSYASRRLRFVGPILDFRDRLVKLYATSTPDNRRSPLVGIRSPKFWFADGGLMPLLLSPLSAIYASATARRMTRTGWQASVPVICCGRVSVIDAASTAVALDLGRRLSNRGIRAHFLLRGFGARLTGPVRVDLAKHTHEDVGDTALVLASDHPTWVATDRAAGARAAIAAGAQAIVMDDGLQNPTLEKDLSLLVIYDTESFGNGWVIPSGPLREPVSAATARCQAAVLFGEDEKGVLRHLPRGLPVVRASIEPGPEAELVAGQLVFAFCGAGNAREFFTTVEKAGALLVGREIYHSHYPFDEGDMRELLAKAESLRATLVTTRADFMRIPPAFRNRVTVMTVRLEWEESAAIERLLEHLPTGQRSPSGGD